MRPLGRIYSNQESTLETELDTNASPARSDILDLLLAPLPQISSKVSIKGAGRRGAHTCPWNQVLPTKVKTRKKGRTLVDVLSHSDLSLLPTFPPRAASKRRGGRHTRGIADAA
jgi:hypothetical protein